MQTMKYLPFLLFIVLTSSLWSQPVITENNFNQYWRKFVNGVATSPSGITEGANGANQTWDYTGQLTPTAYDTLRHTPAHVDPDFIYFPNATGAYFSSYDSSTTFYQVKNDGIYFMSEEGFMGTGTSIKLKMLSFPFTNGTVSKDSFPVEFTTINDDTSGMMPFDSIRVKGYFFSTSTGLGYGTLKYTQGNYPNTLKVKNELKGDLKFEVRLKLTKSWIDASSWIPAEAFSEKSIMFISQDYQDVIMQMNMDTLNQVEEVHYRLGINSSIDKRVNPLQTKMYPNPSHGTVMVEVSEPSDLYIYDLQGRQLFSNKVSGLTSLDISSMPKGIYIYRIQSAEKSSTGKLQIQ